MDQNSIDNTSSVSGWMVGLIAAGLTGWFLFSGGVDLPAGRYPIVVLALIFVGPPLVVGGVVGGLVSLTVSKSIGAVSDAQSKTRVAHVRQLGETISDKLLRFDATRGARELDRSILPDLQSIGLTIFDNLPGDTGTLMHIASRAGRWDLIEILADRPQTVLKRYAGQFFFDVAPPGCATAAMQPFVKGSTAALAKSLAPADAPLTAPDEVAFADWTTKLIEAATAASAPTIVIDVDAFKRMKLSEVRCIRGAQLYDGGKASDAVDLLSSAIRLDPDYPQAFRIRGLAYAAIGNHDAAIKDYSEAVRLKPDFAAAYNNRGLSQQSLKNFTQAEADFNEALRLDGESTDVLVNRGAYFFNDKRNIRQAVADFQRALKLNPSLAVAQRNLDLAYASRAADDAALSKISNAIAMTPDDAVALEERGRIYYIRYMHDLALHDLDKALALSPDAMGARELRAAIHLAVGNLEASIADYREVCRVRPDVSAYFNMGLANERLGRLHEAITCFKRVLAIDPGADDAASRLADLEKR